MFCVDSALPLHLLHRFHAQHIVSILVAVRLMVGQLDARVQPTVGCSGATQHELRHPSVQPYVSRHTFTCEYAESNDLPRNREAVARQ